MRESVALSLRRGALLGVVVVVSIPFLVGSRGAAAAPANYLAPVTGAALGDPCRLLLMDLSTPEGLVAVGLQDSEVPGAQRYGRFDDANQITATGVVPCAAASAQWLVALRPGSAPTRVVVAQDLLAFASAEAAHLEFVAGEAFDATDETKELLPSPGVGEEDFLVRWRVTSDPDLPGLGQYLEAFRRGNVIVAIGTTNSDDAAARADAIGYARLIDGRLLEPRRQPEPR